MKSVVFLNLEIIECDSPKCFLYFFKKLTSFGAVVRVPLFINEGEVIQIDTRDGSYLGRVNA